LPVAAGVEGPPVVLAPESVPDHVPGAEPQAPVRAGVGERGEFSRAGPEQRDRLPDDLHPDRFVAHAVSLEHGLPVVQHPHEATPRIRGATRIGLSKPPSLLKLQYTHCEKTFLQPPQCAEVGGYNTAMFTGLVQALGTVRVAEDDGHGGRRFGIAEPEMAPQLSFGESVAVNGACMTVIAAHADWFVFEAGPESLARTTLKELAPGDRVNLERALRAGDLLGAPLV